MHEAAAGLAAGGSSMNFTPPLKIFISCTAPRAQLRLTYGLAVPSGMAGPLCFRAFTSHDNSNYKYFLTKHFMRMKQKFLPIIALLLMAATGAWAQTYTVTLKEGTEDADKWTISPASAAEGETVTATYKGEKKVKSVKAVKVDAAPAAVTTATPLTMECLSDGTIKVNMSSEMFFGMQYAVNGGDKTKITTTTTIGDLTKGDKVQFYGVLTGTQAYGSSPSVMISGGSATVKVYGNIMSLVDETGFANNTELKSENAFTGLFSGNDKLTDASGLLLPATTLNQDCYANMFYGCTALTAAPELPATELVNGCYYKMFDGCTKLATVTCKATKEITVFHGLDNWLEGAGTDESITSRTLYVDPTMVSNTGWQNANFTVTAIPGN